jgi:hypothetical protein
MTITQDTRTDERRQLHTFSVQDGKGRFIGAEVRMHILTVGEENGWGLLPGTYFAWMGLATRAGKTYGALQQWRHCATEAERDAAIAKYLRAAQARANKTAAKAA